MDEPVWLSRRIVDAAHADQLRQHGGAAGLRDENALESALARPRNKWVYEPDIGIASLAAAYGYGLATNHGYSAGNKSVAFMAMYLFLGLNDWELEVAEPEVVEVMLSVADGRLGEKALALWVHEHIFEEQL